MIRIMVVLWTVLAASVGVGLFLLKHEVQTLEEELARLNQTIRSTQENIHVLKAEWSFLNDPARLHRLAERHLGMKVLKPEQITMAIALPAILDALTQSKSQQNQTQMIVRHRPVSVTVAGSRAKSIAANRTRKGTAGRLAASVPHPPLPTRTSPGVSTASTQARVMIATEERRR